MMIRTVGGWVFLLVPAHPGRPGQRAVKQLLLCCCYLLTYSKQHHDHIWPDVTLFSQNKRKQWLQSKLQEMKLVLLLHPLWPFTRTTWISRHQKGKPFWILLEQDMMGWQWHQVDHMQINCTSLSTDNHASTSPLSFYWPDALPVTQATASKQWRHLQEMEKTWYFHCERVIS